jgi:hypothetical protein
MCGQACRRVASFGIMRMRLSSGDGKNNTGTPTNGATCGRAT